MKQKKIILFFLALLVFIKFAYQPWSQWLDEQQSKIDQLMVFSIKQQKAIANQDLLKTKLVEHEKIIATFVGALPALSEGEKANTLWFNLIESIKNDSIKVYNQKSEFESLVTSNIGYVMGSFYLSGNAVDVMQAVLVLEKKSPFVFLDKLVLNRQGRSRSKKEALVVQLYVGYWFAYKGIKE